MNYQEIGQLLQLDRDRITLAPAIAQRYGLDTIIDGRENAINAFNTVSEQEGLPPLRDPLGYMVLDNNLLAYVRQSYREHYEQMRDAIESGSLNGGSYGVNSILTKVNPIVRHDLKNIMPPNLQVSDLRFIKVDANLRSKVDEFAACRSKITYVFMNKRSFDATAQKRVHFAFDEAGDSLARQIDAVWNRKQQPKTLSIRKLLSNSQNNQAGLAEFKQKLAQPLLTPSSDGQMQAQAEFSQPDGIQFLLANRKYLNEHDFKLQKAAGKLRLTWSCQSPKTTKTDCQTNDKVRTPKLNLTGLTEQSQNQQR